MSFAGAIHHRQNYGAKLDRLVQVLDHMTERRVITGRVFSPSTLSERTDLTFPLLVILLAETPNDGDNNALSAIQQLAKKAALMPDGDRSLRRVCRELDQYLKALEAAQPSLAKVLDLLAPAAQFEASSHKLKTIIENSVREIETDRLSRLKAMSVDAIKLERLRSSLEATILKPPAGLPIFRNFVIETRSARLRVPAFDFGLMSSFPKAQLVEPTMDSEIGNLDESLSRRTREVAASLVWESFWHRRYEVIKINSTIRDEAFWKDLNLLSTKIGECPVLLISSIESKAVRQLVYAARDGTTTLKVEQAKPHGVVGKYIATVEGIEVFADDFDAGDAWLFSGRSLECIRYYAVNDAGQHVSLTIELGSNVEGMLRAGVMQVADWTNAPVLKVELNRPDPAG